MNNDLLDIVAFLVAVLTFVTSREIAQAVGPYAAVIVAASAGAAFSISGRGDEMGARKASIYVSVRVLAAVAITISAALAVQKYTGWDARHTLIPIAFLIGWVRDFDHLLELVDIGKRLKEKIVGNGK